MKKKLYLFTIILIAVALFNVSTAKAENWAHDQDYSVGPGNNTSNNDNYSNNNHNNGPANNGGKTSDNAPATSSTNLPINNGIVFLFIAGMVIGIVTIKKFKSLKPVMAS